MGVVNSTFTAVANGNSSEGTNADLVIGGTFVGTVQLQCAIPGAGGADLWVSVGQLTAAGIVTGNVASARKWRAACTAFTSGTIYASMGAALNEELQTTL